jgi:hypothetical protein
VRIRGEAVWAGLGVTEWSGIPCDVSVTDVFVKDRHPVLLVASAQADVATKELLQVATDGVTPDLRALAIRALGRSSHATPAAMVTVWLRDPSIAVRRAAVLVSADLPDREPIMTASRDGAPDIRCAAALAVGFAQDPHLLPLLNNLVRDPTPTYAPPPH